MKLEFEYGQGLLGAELPDSTDIFIPGETVADPPCLPQDWDSLYAATLASIRNPIGMPPLKELAAPGQARWSSSFRTSSRGATSPPATGRWPSVPAWTSCTPPGWSRRTCCCCSPTACTPGPPWPEMQTILGPELFGEFYPTGQITSHDSEDYDHLVDLGYTAAGATT